MIGHSMGGYITLAFAEKFPEKLKGLGLFHSTAYADSEEKKVGREKRISTLFRNMDPLNSLNRLLRNLVFRSNEERRNRSWLMN